MINNVLTKVFGTHNDRELKRISEAFLGPINSLEPSMEKLSDSDLSRKTEEFKDSPTQKRLTTFLSTPSLSLVRPVGESLICVITTYS